MKNIYLTILCVCIAINLSAQTKQIQTKRIQAPKTPSPENVVENKSAVYVLDSFHTDYLDGAYERTYHSYNDRHKLVLSIGHWYDKNGNIEGGLKDERAYDANDNQNLSALYDWNESNKSWTTNYKTESTYDENNNLITELLFSGNGTGWDTTQIRNMTYDAQNRITSLTIALTSKEEYTYLENTDKKTQVIMYQFDASIEDWKDFFKEAHTYDDDKNLVTSISSVWMDNEWVDGLKIEYSGYNQYGDAGNVKEFEMGNTDWLLNAEIIYEYTYDQEGKITETIEKQILRNGSTRFYMSQYAYDQECDNREITLQVSYEKTNEEDVWVGVNKFEFVYEDCLWVDFFAYGWNETSGDWEYVRRNAITYDENRCMYEETGSIWYGSEWISNIFNHYYYSARGADAAIKPLLASSDIVVFSQGENIVVKNNTKRENIRVYDIAGRLRKFVAKPANEEILPVTSGIYLVNIGNYTTKLFVK